MSGIRKSDSQMQREIEAMPDSLEEAIDALEERNRYAEFHNERLHEEADLWSGDLHGCP